MPICSAYWSLMIHFQGSKCRYQSRLLYSQAQKKVIFFENQYVCRQVYLPASQLDVPPERKHKKQAVGISLFSLF
jgi:hypothetical protein